MLTIENLIEKRTRAETELNKAQNSVQQIAGAIGMLNILIREVEESAKKEDK